jgi:hypothetical protein
VLVEDAWQTDNWSGVTGDIAKLGLGLLSIFFDVIFFVQHFVMYTDRQDVSRPDSVNTGTTNSSGLVESVEPRSKAPSARLGERQPLLDGAMPHAGATTATYS